MSEVSGSQSATSLPFLSHQRAQITTRMRGGGLLLRRLARGSLASGAKRNAALAVGHDALLFVREFASVPSTTLRLVSGACDIPHPQKRSTGGEDAWFICSNTVGVADGVGGWARKGVDAGEYSRALMHSAHSVVGKAVPTKQALPSPLEVLSYAHSKATCAGSSTACIVQLNNSSLRAINLGDSGFIVCRRSPDSANAGQLKWQVVYEAPHQCHYFNCPYQLGHQNGDLPESGQQIDLDIQEGDLIILGTDGLFDNLFPVQIASLLDTALPMSPIHDAESMEKAASCIAHTAHKSAKGTRNKTPFALAAQKAGYDFSGGKMDDITVITSLVASV